MTDLNTFLKRGFTLPEVCVAMLVFAFGMLALARFAGGVRNVMSQEREKAEQVILAAQTMERLIANPPPCDSLSGAILDGNSGAILDGSSGSIPGRTPSADYPFFLKHVNLAYVTIKLDFVQINRLVKCK